MIRRITSRKAWICRSRVPEMQANPPQMPAQATRIVGNNFYKWNGLWNFTSNSHPGMWDPQKLALAPRAGIAFRIDDKTALRFGYARYLTPYEMNIDLAPVSGYETVGFLEPPFLGMTGLPEYCRLLQGVPQQTISDPYPGNNPLLPDSGQGLGTNLGRGGQSAALVSARRPTKRETTASTSISSANCRARSWSRRPTS